ncbi:MAG: hypothetical protein U0V48_07420 [Anaerolineales bacterium]
MRVGSHGVNLLEQVLILPFNVGDAFLRQIKGLTGLLAFLFERGHFLSALDDGDERDRDVREERLVFRTPQPIRIRREQ